MCFYYHQSVLGCLYFKVSWLQYNYTFEYWVILINYKYLLYGLDEGYLHAIMHNLLLL